MTSPDREVFQNALSDFTFEAACGGAIRHLADSGFTAKQIMERLDYPISGERLQKALYKHLYDTCVILEKSPEEEFPEAKPEYVLEYNSYGKTSYRRKSTEGAKGSMSGSAGAVWKEIVYKPLAGLSERISKDKSEGSAGYSGRGVELSAFLTKKCGQRKDEAVYISCDFGIPDSEAAKGISLLNGRQQEYLEGILWPRHRVYHKLDHRMKEILCSLYEQHAYEGICYFLLRKEKLSLL